MDLKDAPITPTHYTGLGIGSVRPTLSGRPPTASWSAGTRATSFNVNQQQSTKNLFKVRQFSNITLKMAFPRLRYQ